MTQAVVIGAGPAGLMAADVLAQAGAYVRVVDQMPSVGRKFLMAGKSGLNITKSEETKPFLDAFGPDRPPMLDAALRAFGPTQVCQFAQDLGQELFVGSSGRVFPKVMKASPLLRAWLARLNDRGVTFQTRWRWTGWLGPDLIFDTPGGRATLHPDVTVLALGGASWARLGSDGDWARHLRADVTPFQPANMGFSVQWSPHMRAHFGQPVKGVALIAGHTHVRGEFVITQTGVEGGGIYQVSRPVREGAPLSVDLLPDWPIDKIRAALARPKGKASIGTFLRKVLRLNPVKLALLNEFGRPFGDDLATTIKSLPLHHAGPAPMDGAISTAGGLRFDALDDHWMLHSHKGVFCAGEMLDWEAPTGGYLITGCIATGRAAAMGALRYAKP